MIPWHRSRAKVVAVTVVGALALAACGGGADGGSDTGDALPAVVVPDDVEIDTTVDLTTNLLPDLVVDNLGDGNKVNLRNFGAGDRPTLLWMWAPH